MSCRNRSVLAYSRRYVGAIVLVACATPTAFAADLTPTATPTAVVLQTILRHSVDADTLGASGASAADVSAAIEALTEDAPGIALLAGLESVAAAAEAQAAAAREAAWRSGASPESAAALESLQASAASAASALRSAELEVLNDLVEELSSRPAIQETGAASMLRAAANSGRFVPQECKALDLTDAQWATLERAALKSSRGLPLAQAEVAALSGAISDPITVAAAARIEANVDQIEAALVAALTSNASQSSE